MKREIDKRATSIAPGVWRLQLLCSCAFVLGHEREFWLVDSGTRHDRLLLLQLLAHAVPNARLTHVLLTHAHLDHAGNAAYFARLGARVWLHADEAPFFAGQSYTPQLPLLGRVAFGVGHTLAPVERCICSPELHDKRELATPAGTWRVVSTPGHTPGHVALWRESDRVLFAGDALLNVRAWTRSEGLTLPMPIYSSDVAQARESARKLVALRPHILAPGHGKVAFEVGTAVETLDLEF